MVTYVIDIETVARKGIENTFYLNWAYKKGAKDEMAAIQRAGLHPEFGMVCSIGVAPYGTSDDTPMVQTAKDEDEEKEALKGLATLLDEDCKVVGHNVKRFDIPYLVKAYLRHNMEIPKALRQSNEKNWLDTMEILAMGGTQMSLRAACLNMGIPDPKVKCCGDNIYDMFINGEMEAIAEYNNNDVCVTREVYDRILKSHMMD